MAETKQCRKCKQQRNLADFALKHDKERKYQWYDAWCIHCYRERARTQRANNPQLSQKSKLCYERKRRAYLAKYIAQYLGDHPCTDCGESDPVVLDFDHVRGEKRKAIAWMVSHQWGIKSILAEIEKCEIRCANCHRRKTARVQGWKRLNY